MNDTYRDYFCNHPTSDEFAAEVGGRNWVLHRRTPRIVAKYGDDVICLSQKAYDAAAQRALAKRRALLMCEGA